MRVADEWTPVAVPEMARLPGAVYLRAQALPAGHRFPPHTHDWNQLVYATSGVLVVTVGDNWFCITPRQAIWVPAGTLHSTGALQGAAFRNLYVECRPGLPADCRVLAVSPLLAALIMELQRAGDMAASGQPEDAAYLNRVDTLILDQLQRQPRQDFHLPWPRSARLRQICAALYDDPADPRTMAEWGTALGASARTLSRHFEAELGLPLRLWRGRLRLFRALEWLTAGRPVTAIALDLGYASPSAFSYMFHQAMGLSPVAWRLAQGGAPAASGAVVSAVRAGFD